jgi:hypothetical protein
MLRVACAASVLVGDALGANAPAGSGAPSGSCQLDWSERQVIVDTHNHLRAQNPCSTANGGGWCPPCPAADMQRLAWDDALAAAAQVHADQCVWAEDERNRANGWGENLATWTRSEMNADALTSIITSWYNELYDANWTDSGLEPKVHRYESGEVCVGKCYNAENDKCVMKHYTQVVWASTTHVGCAVSSCKGFRSGYDGLFLVCKYSPAGNELSSSGRIRRPYLFGSPCAACPNQCTDNLCDVGVVPNRCLDPTNCSVPLGLGTQFCGVPYSELSNGDEEIDDLVQSSGSRKATIVMLIFAVLTLNGSW